MPATPHRPVRPAPNVKPTAESVAAVFGLTLYDKRLQRAKQLNAVRAAMAMPGFPAKSGNGYIPRAELQSWVNLNIELHKGGRQFVVVDHARRNATTKDGRAGGPPPAESGAAGDSLPVAGAGRTELEVAAILRKLPPDQRTRLTNLYNLWLHAKPLKNTDRQELVLAGLVADGSLINPGSPVNIPEYCTQNDFAKLMGQLYNVPVYPMQVSRAINKEGMPGRMSNQSIKTSLAIPWWEANKVQREIQGNLLQLAAAAEQQKKIDDARKAKVEADEAERVSSNKWMLMATHENTMAAAGMAFKTSGRDVLEKLMPRVVLEALRAATMTPPNPAEAADAGPPHSFEAGDFQCKTVGGPVQQSLDLEAFSGVLLQKGRELFDQMQRQLGARLDELLANAGAHKEKTS